LNLSWRGNHRALRGFHQGQPNNSLKLTGVCVLVMVTWMPFDVVFRQLNSGVMLLRFAMLGELK
jgi:hypothetical protein